MIEREGTATASREHLREDKDYPEPEDILELPQVPMEHLEIEDEAVTCITAEPPQQSGVHTQKQRRTVNFLQVIREVLQSVRPESYNGTQMNLGAPPAWPQLRTIRCSSPSKRGPSRQRSSYLRNPAA